MPTGYTAAVQDGTITELEDYALQCARAFGACVMQRDDDPSEPPKEQVESPYHKDKIKEIQNKIKNIEKMSDIKLIEYEKSSLEKNIRRYKERIVESLEQKTRYESMLDKVKAWQSPSPEHDNYKAFMIKQLEESIDFDCNNDYWEVELVKAVNDLENLENPSKIRKNLLEDAKRDLEYHQKEAAKETERVNARNQWIRRLNESLKK